MRGGFGLSWEPCASKLKSNGSVLIAQVKVRDGKSIAAYVTNLWRLDSGPSHVYFAVWPFTFLRRRPVGERCVVLACSSLSEKCPVGVSFEYSEATSTSEQEDATVDVLCRQNNGLPLLPCLSQTYCAAESRKRSWRVSHIFPHFSDNLLPRYHQKTTESRDADVGSVCW